jgi:hypothetical protein
MLCNDGSLVDLYTCVCVCVYTMLDGRSKGRRTRCTLSWQREACVYVV